jgi:ribosome biogenesis ATPase
VVNTLLTELDGLESRKQVYVIAATNRPDIVDPAMVRPGRLDKMLYVDLPTPLERISILKAQSHKTPFAPDVDWQSIAHDPLCDRFSGADLNALIRESALAALKDAFASGLEGTQVGLQVRMAHIKLALHKVSPSVSTAQQRRYEALRSKFSGQPVGHRKEATEELSQST